ncbi:hypothetical protein [Methanosarcina siciliae]|uniref:hypothetical protein n=1 Tax=Methanosarcina siciliae TaxID=38027 RepID=UPI00064E4BB5|nr:hypothetical protein [Methanosarcina siciliae]
MNPPDVSLKEYIESRFDGLERLIDTKFENVEATAKKQTETLCTLECRVGSLERWRAYILGACLVIGFLARCLWEKLL